MLQAQGDTAGALREYREVVAISERLAASDSSNAKWQRDLFMCRWRLAVLCDSLGRDDAMAGWIRTYEQALRVKRYGISEPAVEAYLEAVEQSAGSTGAER